MLSQTYLQRVLFTLPECICTRTRTHTHIHTHTHGNVHNIHIMYILYACVRTWSQSCLFPFPNVAVLGIVVILGCIIHCFRRKRRKVKPLAICDPRVIGEEQMSETPKHWRRKYRLRRNKGRAVHGVENLLGATMMNPVYAGEEGDAGWEDHLEDGDGYKNPEFEETNLDDNVDIDPEDEDCEYSTNSSDTSDEDDGPGKDEDSESDESATLGEDSCGESDSDVVHLVKVTSQTKEWEMGAVKDEPVSSLPKDQVVPSHTDDEEPTLAVHGNDTAEMDEEKIPDDDCDGMNLAGVDENTLLEHSHTSSVKATGLKERDSLEKKDHKPPPGRQMKLRALISKFEVNTEDPKVRPGGRSHNRPPDVKVDQCDDTSYLV